MSRYLIGVVAILICSQTTFGQDEKPSIYLGLQVSPNFTYRVLTNNTDRSEVDETIDFLNNREKAAFGYRAAAVVGVSAFGNWDLEIGISYLRNCVNYNLSFGDQPDSRRGFTLSEPFDEADLKTCYHYMGIPVRAIWNVGTEHIKFLASVGFTPQILLSDEAILISYLNGEEIDRVKGENLQEVNGFNLSPQLGLGIQIKLSDHFFLRGEGIARFGVLNIDDDSDINSYLYSSELNLAIHYRMR